MHTLLCLALMGVAAAALAAPAGAVERFYVAPLGNDQWSGRQPAANAGRTDGPFATLRRAQTAVRALKEGGLKAPVEVILAAGTYGLDAPLTFTPADSGTEACPITWRAAEGAKVTLSGGRPITDWRREADGLWSAAVHGAREGQTDFRLLRVGEKWAIRARHPNFDATAPLTGGWAFAQFAGEPWERGAFGTAVGNIHNVGDKLTWTLRVPADGVYRVWVRYAHKMKDYQTEDMGGHTALVVDDGAPVPLQDLPDTGGWGAFRWSLSAALTLTAGTHRLVWVNQKGGGLSLDALALCSDAGWNPEKAIGKPTWWGACDIQPPAAGTHLLVVQAEACEKAEGPEITVPKPSPPGSTRDMCFAAGALPAVADAAGAEVHVFIAWGWVNAIVPVERIDNHGRRIQFAGEGAAQDVRIGNRFFVENARELLDAPGEWFLDKKQGRLLHLPDAPGFPNVPVVAPLLDRLIVFQGDPATDQWVEHLIIDGLSLTDTTYSLTKDYYTPADAAIWASGARRCVVRGCDFSWCGGYALRLENRSERIEFSRNHVRDMGQGGVISTGGTADQAHHNALLGNTLERLGLIYKHVAGVYVVSGSDNRIAHNRITAVPRYAISLKSQGEGRLSHRNVVEYNDMRRVNLETNDTGAFESLGYEHRDSGNVVRFNRILDSVGMATTPDGKILTPHFTWGIYLDDYSSGTTVYGNIVARTVNGGVNIHGGQNNVIENNIFVDGHEHQVRLQPRDDFMRGNRFERNIVAYSRPEAALVFSWNHKPENFAAWDNNLYWLRGADLSALKNTPAGTFADWQKAGHDAHSQVADPLFENPEKDDYRLKPDSPALALGFHPIPVEKIGPEGME